VTLEKNCAREREQTLKQQNRLFANTLCAEDTLLPTTLLFDNTISAGVNEHPFAPLL
jgi:hypothetical protein